MITQANFTLQFDRNIDKDLYILSPGGYQAHTPDKELQFDFQDFYGEIQPGHPDHLLCECKTLDEDVTNVSIENFKEYIPQITGWDEFFVYTGEYNDPEIHPIAVKDLSLYVTVPKTPVESNEYWEVINHEVYIAYHAKERLLEKINRTLTDGSN